MIARSALIVVAVAGVAACSLTKRTPGTCASDGECPGDQHCNTTASPHLYHCVPNPGGSGGGAGGGGAGSGGSAGSAGAGGSGLCSDTNPCPDGGMPYCDPSGVCVECLAVDQCKGRPLPVCDVANKTCVECLARTDCAGSTPICDAKACRACRSDSECPDPGICMEDGHCAAATEIAYVEFNGSACPSSTADGSSAKPFCAPNDAVAVLGGTRRVVVIRGAMAASMTIGATVVPPIVIGRRSGAGDDASIPATASTAISISSGNALIRDLKVVGGTASTSKGIVVTGAGTKARLLGVTVALTTGLGVQADTGAELDMDRCLVQGNSAGGILITGAAYDIQNTIIANNLYGVTFNATDPPSASRFWFNTVAGNTGNAASCDASKPRVLTNSIVLGVNGLCTLDDSITATTSLGPTFHLTAGVPCPTEPYLSPNYDFDGDPRTVPVDCGADQFKM
jgi:hypothetical protein